MIQKIERLLTKYYYSFDDGFRIYYTGYFILEDFKKTLSKDLKKWDNCSNNLRNFGENDLCEFETHWETYYKDYIHPLTNEECLECYTNYPRFVSKDFYPICFKCLNGDEDDGEICKY